VTIALGVDPIMGEGEIALAPPAGQAASEIAVVPLRCGARQTIKGSGPAHSARLFRVAPGVTLHLEDVTIREFSVYDPSGGGAIQNDGTLRLSRCAFVNNSASYSGTGAMTAFAECRGGAIASSGAIILGSGTRFEGNRVSAHAQTASFTTTSAFGGAIASTGKLTIEADVAFADNAAVATASSGYHPMPGGASSVAAGGAIHNAGGTITVAAATPGSCAFAHNAATADASAPSDVTYGPRKTSRTSRGGALYSDNPIVQSTPGACRFDGDTAEEGPSIYVSPAAPAPPQ
jgi:predicted outer membrane repeat protein